MKFSICFLLAIALVGLASSLVYASDPSPLQDFCVAVNDSNAADLPQKHQNPPQPTDPPQKHHKSLTNSTSRTLAAKGSGVVEAGDAAVRTTVSPLTAVRIAAWLSAAVRTAASSRSGRGWGRCRSNSSVTVDCFSNSSVVATLLGERQRHEG
ncbi:unnamed protein product [Fraxinus pennsylvanica]|uniref:Uncharacterized protein n=1 Tax=Fraxinus pennsylvanica TaxID=56036 RepID=A0AAD1YZ15_9LAMI|nr:unnamed protein product [Fraxinus pennsylvanica]